MSDPLADFYAVCMIAPESHLVKAIDQVAEAYAKARSADPGDVTKQGTMAASFVLHTALIDRGMVIEALDLFSRLNAVECPLPKGTTYTEYVEATANR